MHKRFYASGFLFHLDTQQILLHQPQTLIDPSSLWCMFSHLGNVGEDAQRIFTIALSERINVQIEATCIYPVYDYYSESLRKDHYIFYALVPKTNPLFLRANDTVSWFTFKQLTKLPLSDQTKHDIMISERVIRAHAEGLNAQ